MSERPSSGRGIADAFRNRERGGRPPAGSDGPAPPPGAKQRRKKRKKTGKRSNEAYTQVSALVMKDVKARFAVAQAQASLEEGRRLEFGELVNLLMAHFALGGVDLEELRDSLEELLRE